MIAAAEMRSKKRSKKRLENGSGKVFGTLLAFAVFFIGSAFFTCSHEPSPAYSDDDLRYYANTLSANDMAGRESGTEFANKAAHFIAAEYRRSGLVPAFGTSYLQEFSFSAGVEFAKNKNRYELFPGAKSASEATSAKNARKFSGPASPFPFANGAKVEGSAVFLGFCLKALNGSWNDYARARVKNKIILCLRHGPGGLENTDLRTEMSFLHKYKQAKKAGVKAIIYLSRKGGSLVTPGMLPARSRKGPVALFISDPAPFHKALPFLVGEEKRLLAKKKSKYVGRSVGYMRLQSQWKRKRRTGFNVGALLRKARAGEKRIIIGAHLDHLGEGNFSSMKGAGKIHPGADDNASGVAVTLELAALMRSRYEKTFPAKKNVLFLNFDAEERGLHGSRYFVKQKTFKNYPTIAMINLDMVGRLRKKRGLSVQGTDTADGRLKTLVQNSFDAAGFKPDYKLKLLRGGIGPSDHTSFYNARVPILFIHTGSHSDYHTPADVQSRLNIHGMNLTAVLVEKLAISLVGLNRPLAYRRIKLKHSRSMHGYRLRLGIVPGSYGEDGGVLVGGVRDGTPISRTGIKEGDRIIQIGTQKIENIHDLMEFLASASAKRDYRLVYTRNKKAFTVHTKLIAR